MQVKTRPTVTATIKRTFEITDGPVVDHPWSRSGKRMKIQYVTIEYTWNNAAERWVAGSYLAIHLSGAVLKKDSTPGKERYNGQPAGAWNRADEYRWLRDLIADAIPEHQLPYFPDVPEDYR